VDRKEATIIALHFSTLQMEKPLNIIKGKMRRNVYAKIIELGLVTELDHAAYLGSQLTKAEIALIPAKNTFKISRYSRDDLPAFQEVLRSWNGGNSAEQHLFFEKKERFLEYLIKVFL